MNCTRFCECISLYIDNELNDIEKENFEKHLNECKNCKNEYEEMLSITNILRDTEEVELPKNYNETLRQKLENVDKSKNKKFNFKRFSSIAAAVVVLVTSVTLIMNNKNLKQDNVAYDLNESSKEIERFNISEEAQDDASRNDSTQYSISSLPQKSLMKDESNSLEKTKIIRNESLYINTDDLNNTNINIVNIIENNKGYVELNDIKYLRARVYVDEIDDVINSINQIAEVSNINTNNTDITEEYKETQNTINELRNTEENDEKIDEEIIVYEELLQKYNQMLEYPNLEIYFNSKSE